MDDQIYFLQSLLKSVSFRAAACDVIYPLVDRVAFI